MQQHLGTTRQPTGSEHGRWTAHCCLRLHGAIRFGERTIRVVELPFPKLNSDHAEEYEHIEFVVPEILSAAELLAFTQRYPELPWDLGDLHKTANPDVPLRYAGFSVKFHGQPLADATAQELRDQR